MYAANDTFVLVHLPQGEETAWVEQLKSHSQGNSKRPILQLKLNVESIVMRIYYHFMN